MRRIWIALALVWHLGLRLWAAELPNGEKQGPVFTVLEENDLIVNTDRHCTQGIKLSYFHTDDYFPFASEKLYAALPELWFEKSAGKFGYAVGQNIYTPADLSDPNPD